MPLARQSSVTLLVTMRRPERAIQRAKLMTDMTKAQLLQLARDVGRVLIDAVAAGEVRASRPDAGNNVRELETKDLDSYRALVAASLVASMCDGFTATMAVLRSRGQGHVFSILRSMHESLADLILLGKDPAYIERIGYAEMQKLTTQLQNMLHKTHRPALTPDEKSRVLGALVDCGRCLKELRRAGVTGGLEPKRKFERAGMGQEYRTVYFLLSGFGHNAPGTLAYRHLAANRSHLQLGKRLDRDTLYASVYFACRTLMRAVEQLLHHGIVDEPRARSAVGHAAQKLEVIERSSQLRRAA